MAAVRTTARRGVSPRREALLHDIGKSFARPPAGLTRDVREALLQYHWPGNVREHRNALERATMRLGLTRTQLYLWLQKHGLEKPVDA